MATCCRRPANGHLPQPEAGGTARREVPALAGGSEPHSPHRRTDRSRVTYALQGAAEPAPPSQNRSPEQSGQRRSGRPSDGSIWHSRSTCDTSADGELSWFADAVPNDLPVLRTTCGHSVIAAQIGGPRPCAPRLHRRKLVPDSRVVTGMTLAKRLLAICDRRRAQRTSPTVRMRWNRTESRTDPRKPLAKVTVVHFAMAERFQPIMAGSHAKSSQTRGA